MAVALRRGIYQGCGTNFEQEFSCTACSTKDENVFPASSLRAQRRVTGPGLQAGGYLFCRPGARTGRRERVSASLAGCGSAVSRVFSWEETEGREDGEKASQNKDFNREPHEIREKRPV